MERIESANNKVIKFTNSLKIKKNRKEEGLFIAEGERLVLDGIKKQEPLYIIVSDSFPKCDFPYKTYIVSDSIFKKLTDTVNPQGILAVFKMSENKLSDISPGNTVVLSKLQDPGNMGTILRTANATGFYNVIIDKECVDLYNPKTVRSSMSALFDQNIYFSDNLKEDLLYLKNKGFAVAGSLLSEESEILYKTEIKHPVALIIGNEANGMDKELEDICDKKVIIPMKGNIESLNASVAASVIMYEFLRRQEYEV